MNVYILFCIWLQGAEERQEEAFSLTLCWIIFLCFKVLLIVYIYVLYVYISFINIIYLYHLSISFIYIISQYHLSISFINIIYISENIYYAFIIYVDLIKRYCIVLIVNCVQKIYKKLKNKINLINKK